MSRAPRAAVDKAVMHVFAQRLARIREEVDALTADCYRLILAEQPKPPVQKPAKKSSARAAVIALFAAGEDVWTAQEVYRALHRDGFTCTLTTVRVYLSDLCAVGELTNVGQNRYQRPPSKPMLVKAGA